MLALFINRAEQVGRALNILDSQGFVNVLRLQIQHGEDGFVVGVGFANGFLENGWIGCHAQDAFFIYSALQITIIEVLAMDVIQPGALSISLNVNWGIAHQAAASCFGILLLL